jgi:hypothetical protein
VGNGNGKEARKERRRFLVEEVECKEIRVQTGKKGAFPSLKKWPSLHPLSFGPPSD